MTRRPRDLTGTVVAITGGARGIGAAIASALAAEGARVAIGDLDATTTERAAKQIGHDVIGLLLDVTDHARYTHFLDEVEATLGPLEVLINNAGIMPIVDFEDESVDSIQRQLDVNLHAVIHGTQQALLRMRPRGSGHIVNIASAAGKMGFAGVATYCATKHGVVGLSEALHYELAGTGIDITCVMPAIVRTELTDGVDDHWLIKSCTPEDVAAAVVHALRRPRLDVMVPARASALVRSKNLMPRTVSDAAVKAAKADQLLRSAAHSPDRVAYETPVSAP
jgi:NAD(P)-dependent dehydrogenase (short-subunit alcohol dehydrogenase family)